MKTPFFSVFIPTYNRQKILQKTINCVLKQTFLNYEIIIGNNASGDSTEKYLKSLKNPKIKFYSNKKNLGYPGNLQAGIAHCKGKYIFILADDDLIDKNTLQIYHSALQKHKNAGAVTRPYYWFETDYKIPIRKKISTTNHENILIDINSNWKDISLVLSSLDQTSGLCFKKSLIDIPFNKNPWISHAYPWLSIFKKHPIIFIGKYILAVRSSNSATRTNIYQKSPMQSWKEMIDYIFSGKKYQKIRDKIITDFIAINYVGLVQIRNYGTFGNYIREIKNLISYRPKNLFNPHFYFWLILTLLLPPKILNILTDKYKTIYLNKKISKSVIINFN